MYAVHSPKSVCPVYFQWLYAVILCMTNDNIHHTSRYNQQSQEPKVLCSEAVEDQAVVRKVLTGLDIVIRHPRRTTMTINIWLVYERNIKWYIERILCGL